MNRISNDLSNINECYIKSTFRIILPYQFLHWIWQPWKLKDHIHKLPSIFECIYEHNQYTTESQRWQRSILTAFDFQKRNKKDFKTFSWIDKAEEGIHISSFSSPSIFVLLHTKVWFIPIVCATNRDCSIHIKYYKVWHFEGSTNLMSLTVSWSVTQKKILDINISYKHPILSIVIYKIFSAIFRWMFSMSEI